MMKTCPKPNAAQIARSFAKKIPSTQANNADDADIDMAGDEDQSTATKEVDGKAKLVPAAVAEEVARQMAAACGSNVAQQLSRIACFLFKAKLPARA